jgi:chaperonin cofactor prefoldin
MKFEALRPAINSSTLMLYRVFSIFSLYAVLAGVLAYAAGVAFYAVSTSWAAPVILSQADRESLELTGKLLQTQGTVENLGVDIVRLEQQVAEAQSHLTALRRLEPALDAAIEREQVHKERTGPALVKLTKQKQSDNAKTEALVHKLVEVGARIDMELAAGLITKADEIQLTTQFAKQNGDLTDSKISALLLKDTIMEKMTPTTNFLEILSKKAELSSEVATLQINIATSQKQIETDQEQIARLEHAIETVRDTPYFLAADGKVDLALVPYENQAAAIKGAPVYDCYLSFVICRHVGTVKRLFTGEQHGVNPVFRTDLRGFLIHLDLTEPEAAKSKTLFLGRKPLFF